MNRNSNATKRPMFQSAKNNNKNCEVIQSVRENYSEDFDLL